MTAESLAQRVYALFIDGKWIANTNYKEQITSIDYKTANKKVANLNSIALLTFHVNYYIKGLNTFFETGKLTISDKHSFDADAINSEEAWHMRCMALINNATIFSKHIAAFSNEKLNDVFVDEKYGNYARNINGLIEHSYYHLGQIVLIKKLIQSEAY